MMMKFDVMIIGGDPAFSVTVLNHLSALGWSVENFAFSDFRVDAEAISDDTVLLVVVAPPAGEGLAAIQLIRAQWGYGPGIIALTGRNQVTKALEAGADIFVNLDDAMNILSVAIPSVRDMAARWRDGFDAKG